MRLGIWVRNMGPASTPALIAACARYAEEAGLADIWVCDHIAIPQEESEGSGGRYLDPLATLSFLSGVTTRIGLGVSVLIVPYRPALPTAKWIASIQELSNHRLRLGVGVGWMEAEFRALGIPRTRRGVLADQTLDFFKQCFANDEVELNGQRFLFNPRPPPPPILIGGAGAHCFERAVRVGQGWMPNSIEPEKLAEPIKELRAAMEAAGKDPPQVVPMGLLPLDDYKVSAARLAALEAVGATGFIQAGRYATIEEFKVNVDALAALA